MIKEKMVSRQSYLYNRNLYAWKDSFIFKLDPGVQCNMGYPLETHLKHKPCSCTTSLSVVHSFWRFSQSTAVILYSVQNCKTIAIFKRMFWTNNVLQDLSLRWVSDRYFLLHSIPNRWNIVITHSHAPLCCVTMISHLSNHNKGGMLINITLRTSIFFLCTWNSIIACNFPFSLWYNQGPVSIGKKYFQV